MAVLFPVFKEISTLFSIAAELVCIPRASQILSGLIGIWGSQEKRGEGGSKRRGRGPIDELCLGEGWAYLSQPRR